MPPPYSTVRHAIVFVFLVIGLSAAEPPWVKQASANAELAAEGYSRSRRALHAWLGLADPTTGLLPRGDIGQYRVDLVSGARGRSEFDPNWVVRDCAADLYPFLVIAAAFTEPDLLRSSLLPMLRQEMLLTRRLGELSDDIQPGSKGWVRPARDVDEIVFGSSEYMKDGLLPITEILGETPWYGRLRGLATDLVNRSPYAWKGAALPAQTSEVNGNALQVLARLSWKTRDPRYLSALLHLADFYFVHQLPATHYLPAHEWDIATDQPKQGAFDVSLRATQNRASGNAADRPAQGVFVLADHGNEIVGGLTEAFLCARTFAPDRASRWEPALRKLLDRVLETGRNDDRLWVTSVDVATGKVVDPHHAHCWGYMFNAVYTGYLLTGDERYRTAVREGMDSVARRPDYLFDEKGAGRRWGANAYSDSIEGALVLLNRIPHPALERAMDQAIVAFYARQRPDGFIEASYADGNFIRTAILFALYKAQGAFLSPLDPGVQLGAVREGDSLNLIVRTQAQWTGRLRFDIPRHREHWNMARNYPRLNEWPEWFTVEPNHAYTVSIDDQPPRTCLGFELRDGLPLSLAAGTRALIRVTP